jgi:replicative DNA helicase
LNAHDPNIMRQVPHNEDAEQALLGAILVNNAAFDQVSSFLEAEHFYEPLHRKIFEVVESMVRAGRGVNPITIKSYLPENAKVGDMTVAQYLARLAVEAVTVINAKDYGLAIHEMWIRRQAIGALDDVISVAYDLPPDRDILAEIAPAEDKLAALRAERIRGETRKGVGQRYLDSLNAAKQRDYGGVPIGIKEVARVISEPAFEAGNLYGLLSSSGEGKTSLTLQLIHEALRAGHPVQFLSFDQSPEQCARQMAAQAHGIEARRQRSGDLSNKEMEDAVMFGVWLDRQPFEIAKCNDQSAAQLVGYARTFGKRYGNGKTPLIVVDHIGAIKPEDKRADEGTKAKDINKILKAGADSTGSAFLILNQRNTFGMRRDNPRPIGQDLFGGDPAKQAYDAIFYVYRFLKFLEERRAIASTDADFKKIDKVFPSAVRNEGVDLAEIGAIKVRFGSPHIRERMIFDARLTRYRPDKPEDELIQQGEML